MNKAETSYLINKKRIQKYNKQYYKENYEYLLWKQWLRIQDIKKQKEKERKEKEREEKQKAKDFVSINESFRDEIEAPEIQMNYFDFEFEMRETNRKKKISDENRKKKPADPIELNVKEPESIDKEQSLKIQFD